MTGPLKAHGGKYYMRDQLWHLTKQIPHKHRVEACCYSASYTLACDPNGYSEVINDVNWEVSNFWSVLQRADLFEQLARLCEATPFSEIEYEYAKGICALATKELLDQAPNRHSLSTVKLSAVTKAHAFLVTVRQSMSARRQNFSPVSKSRTRRGMNEHASAWLSAIEGLQEVHNRLKRVVVLNKDVMVLIDKEDSYDTLFYIDPPYPFGSRTSTGEYGPFEMTDQQHEDLRFRLSKIRGKFLLSSYPTKQYDDWCGRRKLTRIEIDLPNNSSKRESKGREVEVVYSNYPVKL